MAIDQADYGTPRADLGEALMEYINSLSNFIGTQVLPLTEVPVESGNYSAITRESLTERADTKRAAKGAYNRIDLKTKDVSYSCEERGLEAQVDQKDKARYKNDFDAEVAQARKTLFTTLREQEIDIAGLVFDAAVWTGADLYLDVTTVWSDAAATIIANIETAKNAVFANTGMEANALILNNTVLSMLLTNTQILTRVQGAQVATMQVMLDNLALIFGLEKIFVGKGVYNSKPEGATAFSGTPIWSSSYAMVAFVPAVNSPIALPAVGRTFLWTEDSPTNIVAESYEEKQTRSTVVRHRQNTDEKIIDEYFGFLLKID